MSINLGSKVPGAATGLGRKQIAILGIVGFLGMGASALLTYRLATANRAVPANLPSADEARLAARVEERRARAAADAKKLHQQELGQGYQFDAQGNLLGPAADGSNLPRNRSFEEAPGSKLPSVVTADIARGIHQGVSQSADEGGSSADLDEGQHGHGRHGVRGDDDSLDEDTRRSEAPTDRTALVAPMLGYSTVSGANWAIRRPEKSGSSAGDTTEQSGTSKRSSADRQDEAMERLVKTVEQSARLSGSGAESSRTRSDAPSYGSDDATPAEREPQVFQAGGVGDMRIGGGVGPDEIVRQGKFLDCVLVNEIRADLVDSPVIAMVSRDFIGIDGKYVLVPAGAKLLGEAGRIQNLQQERVYIKFDRLLFPDQRSAYFPVRKVSGVNSMGAAGIQGDVDRHLFLQFGAAVMLGVLDGVGAVVQSPSAGTNPTLRDLVMARASGNFSTVIAGVIQKYANVVPTVTVISGSKMKVFFAEDVRLSPYLRTRDLRWARGTR